MLDALGRALGFKDPMWERYRQEAEKAFLFTPDSADIQQMETVNVFVYNECQSGQPKNELLGPCLYRGLGYTESSDFVMYKRDLGLESFPIAMSVEESQKVGLDSPSPSSLIGDLGQVMGEVYTIKNYSLYKLDEYHLNTVYFERKRVPILIPYKLDANATKFEIKRSEVFMWVGRHDHWLPQISDSDAKQLLPRSHRLFAAKEDEPLSAYYVFDHNVEAHRE